MLEEGPDNKKAFESVIIAPRKTEHAIQLAFYKIGMNHIDELSRQMLKKDKTGRVYILRTRNGRRRRHRASAAGQTAANRTGRMRKARTFKLRGYDKMEFGIDGAPYAAFLERGTRKMAPRPSLGNSVEAQEKNTEGHFLKGLERALT